MPNPSVTSALSYRLVKLPQFRSLTLHAISDVHVAADRHQRAALQARLDAVRDAGPSHRIIAHGDWGDIRNKDGKSFAHGARDPDYELGEISELLAPIADRIDLVMPGNHENRIHKQVGLDFMARVVEKVALRSKHEPVWESYRRGPCALKHDFNGRPNDVRNKKCGMVPKGEPRSRVVGLVHHGYGGGRRPGSAVNNLQMLGLCWLPAADYVLMGHVHHKGVFDQVTYQGWPPKVHVQKLVLTSCYVDHEPYAQDMGFQPSATNAPVIWVRAGGYGGCETIVEAALVESSYERAAPKPQHRRA